MNRAASVVGVFALVVALTVGAVAVGGFVLDDGTPEQATVDTSQWELDNVTPDAADDGGEIAMESSESPNTVVVHLGPTAGGGGSVLDGIPLQNADRAVTTGSVAGGERSVGPLVSALAENGHQVEFYEGSRSSFGESGLSDELANADAFVTVAPASLSADERETVTTFAGAGGRVFVGADPGQAQGVVDIGSERGIYQSVGFLANVAENDQNYLSVFAEPAGSSELTAGIDRVVFRGAAPIGQNDSAPVLATGPDTELLTTQRADSYGVAAVDGNVSVVGDTSFLAPENAYRGDNNVLVGNVADFLVTGAVNETVFDGPGEGTRRPPTERTP
jgi:hypothetical protein